MGMEVELSGGVGALVALVVVLAVVVGGTHAATGGASPHVYAYSANAAPSGVITGVAATGECMFASGSHLVEVEMAEATYSNYNVRAVKLLNDGELISSASVDIGETRSGGLCAPLGNSTLVAVNAMGGIVSQTELSVTKIPFDE